MRLMVADEWRRAVGTGWDGCEDLVCDVVAEHLVVVARREHRVVELDEDPHEKLLVAGGGNDDREKVATQSPTKTSYNSPSIWQTTTK